MGGARVFHSTTTAMLYLLNHRHDDDHDDHGGLHRDLSATGSVMGRREVLRRFAFGAGALTLLGCGDAGSGVLTSADTTIDTGGGSTTGGSTCTKIPSEYATSGYGNSASNASQISLASDGVFSDGAALELATVTGGVSSGLVASLTVAV